MSVLKAFVSVQTSLGKLTFRILSFVLPTASGQAAGSFLGRLLFTSTMLSTVEGLWYLIDGFLRQRIARK
jgi:hypothetical protein